MLCVALVCSAASALLSPFASLNACPSSAAAGRRTLSVGGGYTCAIGSSDALSCWGLNSWGQASPPGGSFIDISASKEWGANSPQTCGLRSSGQATCWGGNFDGNCNQHPTGQVAVSAGGLTSYALSSEGAVSGWGHQNECLWGEHIPSAALSGQIFIAGATRSVCSLSSAGGVTCWGSPYCSGTYTPASVHSGQVFLSAIGGSEFCTLDRNGRVSCWNAWSPSASLYQWINMPEDTQGYVSGWGSSQVCTVSRANGTVSCFGSVSPLTSPPASCRAGQVAVEVGPTHACALSSSGIISCWGDNSFGQLNIPSGFVAKLPCDSQLFASTTPTASYSQTGTPSMSMTGTGSSSQTSTASSSPSSSETASTSSSSTSSSSATASVTSSTSQTSTPSSSQTSTPSSSQTSTPTSTLTPGLACHPSLFRSLPRTDLVGAPLTDAPLAVSSEGACRIACCGEPGCDGYAFAFTELRWVSAASCVLLANVSASAPNNFAASGLRVGAHLLSAPASASPVQTPMLSMGIRSASASLPPAALPSVTPPLYSRTISTVAGGGTGLDGDLAQTALLTHPIGVTVDAHGDVFIAECYGGNRVRKVASSTGVISTVACDGMAQFSGDGGPATSASCNCLTRVAFDSSGHMFITEYASNRVRRVDTYSRVITTYVGDGLGRFFGDGGPASSASVNRPYGLDFDSNNNMFIADNLNYRIRRVDAATRIISTLAGCGVFGYGGDGFAATNAPMSLMQVSFDRRHDTVYFADYASNRVRMVNITTGLIKTVAGSGSGQSSSGGGQATSAGIVYPESALVSGSSLFVSEEGTSGNAGFIRVVNLLNGSIETLLDFNSPVAVAAGLGGLHPEGLAIGPDGSLYFVANSDGLHVVARVTSALPLTPWPTPSMSPTPYCVPVLFRSLPHMDLVGTLVNTASTMMGASLFVASAEACRQACERHQSEARHHHATQAQAVGRQTHSQAQAHAG